MRSNCQFIYLAGVVVELSCRTSTVAVETRETVVFQAHERIHVIEHQACKRIIYFALIYLLQILFSQLYYSAVSYLGFKFVKQIGKTSFHAYFQRKDCNIIDVLVTNFDSLCLIQLLAVFCMIHVFLWLKGL